MMDSLPYGRQELGPEEEAAIREVLASDWLTQGPRVPEFESAFARHCGAAHAVAVTNGTSALFLACRAVGLGKGDRFLTTPVTFAGTANAAVLCGAEPVFIDIDPATFCLDPELVRAALCDDPAIKIVLPVHLGGLVVGLDEIAGTAVARGVVVIEDACHAVGGCWQDAGSRWHQVGDGSFSALSCFSFHPVKALTTGEGGAVTTSDPDLARRLRELRSHGITRDPERLEQAGPDWYHEMQELGINARLSDLQAALGVVQLNKLDRWRRRRLEIVQRYDLGLAEVPEIRTQARPAGEDRSCWHLMIVRSARRDALYEHLRAQGIQTQVHYIPVHMHPYYRRQFGTGPGLCPQAEAYHAESLSLPLFPGMTDEDCDRVIEAVREFHARPGSA